jgi:hypothetical protein
MAWTHNASINTTKELIFGKKRLMLNHTFLKFWAKASLIKQAQFKETHYQAQILFEA